MNSTSKEENIISIEFGSNIKVTTPAVFQHDTGQILKFINVPDGAEVQFSNSNSEKTSNRIIQESQVIIPDFLIAEGLEITAYVQYINEDSQTTKKKITIPIIPRADTGYSSRTRGRKFQTTGGRNNAGRSARRRVVC